MCEVKGSSAAGWLVECDIEAECFVSEKHKVPTKYITLIKDIQACDDVCPDM